MLRLTYKSVFNFSIWGCIICFAIIFLLNGCSKNDSIPTREEYRSVLEELCHMPGGPELNIKQAVGLFEITNDVGKSGLYEKAKKARDFRECE